MASAYSSPGVTVRESVTPSLTPLNASPAIVAIVGAAQGSQSSTEQVVLSGTTPVTLSNRGITIGSIVVTDPTTGLTVGSGSYSATLLTDPDATVTGDETYQIVRVASPSTPPTVVAGTGSLTGTYVFAVSYTNAGGETGISQDSAPVILTNQGASLSAIPVGAAGTTARNIYRKKTAGTGADLIYHLIATIADNTTTVLSNNSVPDNTAILAPSPKAGIADGGTVTVSYNYADVTYYQPTLLDNFGDITAKYGQPYDANGNVSSALSFAARLSFLNGASEIVCAASPTSSQVDVQNALGTLANDPTIRIVVIADGSAGSVAALAAHVQTMNNLGYYRIGVAGRDGTTTPITTTSLRTSAQGINYEAIRLVSPTNFTMENPTTRTALNVGGQYAAAAIAGMYAARDVQIPLTRKPIAGFTGINDIRTSSDLVLDSQSGLLVIDLFGGVLRVRHDITTAPGSVNTREASVVRAKYELATRLKLALDAGVVGMVAPKDRATLVVQSVVIGVCEQMLQEQAINSYGNVNARIANADPTTIQVQFEYGPAYPINNIQVTFAINTTTGDFSLT